MPETGRGLSWIGKASSVDHQKAYHTLLLQGEGHSISKKASYWCHELERLWQELGIWAFPHFPLLWLSKSMLIQQLATGACSSSSSLQSATWDSGSLVPISWTGLEGNARCTGSRSPASACDDLSIGSSAGITLPTGRQWGCLSDHLALEFLAMYFETIS